MRTRYFIVILLCGLLAVAGPFPRLKAAEAPAAAPAQYWSVVPLLPAGTLGVIHIPDVAKTKARLEQTGVWRIGTDPAIQKAFLKPVQQAQGWLQFAGNHWGFQAAELLTLFSESEWTLALVDLEPNPNGDFNGKLPALVLSVQARTQGPALMDELEKRVQQLNGAAGDTLHLDRQQLDDGTLVQSVGVHGQSALYYALCDGNVLLALRLSDIERLVKLHRAGDKAPSGCLAGDRGFAYARQRAGNGYDLLAYVNWQGVLKNPLMEAGPKTEEQREQWAAHNIRGIRSLSYSLSIQGNGVHELVFLDLPAAERKGGLTLLDNPPLKADCLAMAPATALAACAWNVSPDGLFTKVLALLESDPAARQALEAKTSQALHLDVKKTLADSFTGEVAGYLSMPAARSKLGVTFPLAIVSVALKDPAAFTQTLNTLSAALAGQVQIEQSPAGDKVVTTVHWHSPSEGQFSYVVTGREWLLAAYPLALSQELARRADKSIGPLSSDADFTTTRRALTGAASAVLYLDTPTLAGALVDIALPLWQIHPERFKIDVRALPGGDVLRRNLSGLALGLGADPTGLWLEGYSPTGFLPAVAGINGADKWFSRGRPEQAENKPAALPVVPPAPPPARADQPAEF